MKRSFLILMATLVILSVCIPGTRAMPLYPDEDDPPEYPTYDAIQSINMTWVPLGDFDNNNNYTSDWTGYVNQSYAAIIYSLNFTFRVPSTATTTGWVGYVAVYNNVRMAPGDVVYFDSSPWALDDWITVGSYKYCNMSDPRILTQFFGMILNYNCQLMDTGTYYFNCGVIKTGYAGYLIDNWTVMLTLNYTSPSNIEVVDLYREVVSSGHPQLFIHNTIEYEEYGAFPRFTLDHIMVEWEQSRYYGEYVADVLANTTVHITILDSDGNDVVYKTATTDEAHFITSSLYNCSSYVDFDGFQLWEEDQYTLYVSVMYKWNSTSTMQVESHEFRFNISSSESWVHITYSDLLAWALSFPGLVICLFALVGSAWKYKNGEAGVGVFVFALAALLIGGVMIYVGLLGGIT